MQKRNSSSHPRQAEEAEDFSLSRQIQPKAPIRIGFRERKRISKCHEAFSKIGGGWIKYGEASIFNEASPEALINATFNQASEQDLIKIIQHLDKLDDDILSRCINARWPLIHNYDCLYKDLPILFPIQQQSWFSDHRGDKWLKSKIKSGVSIKELVDIVGSTLLENIIFLYGINSGLIDCLISKGLSSEGLVKTVTRDDLLDLIYMPFNTQNSQAKSIAMHARIYPESAGIDVEYPIGESQITAVKDMNLFLTVNGEALRKVEAFHLDVTQAHYCVKFEDGQTINISLKSLVEGSFRCSLKTGLLGPDICTDIDCAVYFTYGNVAKRLFYNVLSRALIDRYDKKNNALFFGTVKKLMDIGFSFIDPVKGESICSDLLIFQPDVDVPSWVDVLKRQHINILDNRKLFAYGNFNLLEFLIRLNRVDIIQYYMDSFDKDIIQEHLIWNASHHLSAILFTPLSSMRSDKLLTPLDEVCYLNFGQESLDESDILDIFVIKKTIKSSQFESLLGTYSLMLEHAVKQEHNWECQPNLLTNQLCILSAWIEAGLMTGSYPWAKDVVGRMLKMELITSTSKACPHKHSSLLHAIFEFKDVCQGYGMVLPSDKGQAGGSDVVDFHVLLNPRGFFSSSSSSFADGAGKRLAALAPNKMKDNNSLTNQFRELEAKLIAFLVEHEGYCYHKHGYKMYSRSDFLTRLIDLAREKPGLAARQQKLWKNIKKARCELEEMDQDEVTEERLSKCRYLSLLIDALFKEYGYVEKPKLSTSKELIDFFDQHVIFYLFDTNVDSICLKYGISLLLSQVVKDCELNPIFSSIEQRMEQNYLSIETDVLYQLINDGSFEQSPLEKLLDYLPHMLIAEQPVQSEHNLSLLLSELSSWFDEYTSLDIGDLPAYQKQMNHVFQCISQQPLPKVVERSLGLPTQRFSETLLDSRLKTELVTCLRDLSESLCRPQLKL